MKIITWNIGGGFIESKEKGKYDKEDISYFTDKMKKINPDVICLQEVHFSKNNNQAKIIAENLGFEYFIVHPTANSHLKDGEKIANAIISKYPIISYKFNMLTNPKLKFVWKGKEEISHDKSFIEAKINYKDNFIKVFSGHSTPFRKFGKNFLDNEFKNIREEIEDMILIENIPTIVCADMNFNEEIKKLLPNIFKKKFKSIINTVTTPRGRSYDKIIISKEWKEDKIEIIKGKADHYLCISEINLLQ